jgi:hypothetical protein
LTIVLTLVALMGLKPWEADSVEPRLSLPGFEAAVEDSVALPSGPVAHVSNAEVAPGRAEPVQVAKRQSEAEDAGAILAVAPARAIAVATVPSSPETPAPESGAGDEVPSSGATDVEAPPEGTSSPVATPVSPGGGGAGGPITAGPVLESCDGDEYVITIVLTPESEEGEEASVEIVLQRLNEDGSVDELRLEGDMLDAESLAVQLSAEGNCVVVEAAEPEEADGDDAADAVPAVEAPVEPDAP